MHRIGRVGQLRIVCWILHIGDWTMTVKGWTRTTTCMGLAQHIGIAIDIGREALLTWKMDRQADGRDQRLETWHCSLAL